MQKPKLILSPQDLYRDRVAECMEMARRKFEYAVRPIYAMADNRPVHLGSGVFLKVQGTSLLVTAGHVADEGSQRLLLVGAKEGIVPINSEAVLTTGAGMSRDNDHHDFSIIKLPPAMEVRLDSMTYLTESELCLDLPSDQHAYMAMGFPHSKNKKILGYNIKGKIWSFGSHVVVKPEFLKALGLSAQDHVLLEFDPKTYFDRAGVPMNAISPTGASGGALFDLGHLKSLEALAKPMTCNPRLTGILIEHRAEHKVIVAVSMRMIMDACSRFLSKMKH